MLERDDSRSLEQRESDLRRPIGSANGNNVCGTSHSIGDHLLYLPIDNILLLSKSFGEFDLVVM